jgi:hypothetical protein
MKVKAFNECFNIMLNLRKIFLYCILLDKKLDFQIILIKCLKKFKDGFNIAL